MHPPFLYLGYVGLSMAFSFAVAALIEGRVDAAWARWVRPWTLAAWIALTIGIALGSYWAYYELGWGGWWFWDPVENASFMPWLVAGALLHSAIVVEKRSALKAWTILLAILAFSLSLIGTFLVRSGVITSVHAFANDPAPRHLHPGDPGRRHHRAADAVRLARLGHAVGGRVPADQPRGRADPQQPAAGRRLRGRLHAARPGRLAGARVLRRAKISVGKPFFDLTFTPFMVLLFIALPIGALMPWKRGDAAAVMARLWWAAAGALAIGGIVWGLQTGQGAAGAGRASRWRPG